jgi:hypothetical protein
MVFSSHQLSSLFNDTLQMALQEQMQIGWHQLLLGYMSKKFLSWQRLTQFVVIGRRSLLERALMVDR